MAGEGLLVRSKRDEEVFVEGELDVFGDILEDDIVTAGCGWCQLCLGSDAVWRIGGIATGGIPLNFLKYKKGYVLHAQVLNPRSHVLLYLFHILQFAPLLRKALRYLNATKPTKNRTLHG